MERKIFFRKCFVPNCNNSTWKTPTKIFLSVKECLAKRWCQELEIEYIPKKKLYCCQDHLDFEHDLENYLYWKIMNGRPILKSSATLRLDENTTNMDVSVNMSQNMPSTSREPEGEVLKSLLLQPCGIIQTHKKRKISINPSEVLTSTHPFKVETATQSVPVKMVDKTTCMRKPLKEIMPCGSSLMNISPEKFSTSSPSLYGATSETDSCSNTTQKPLLARQQMLKFIIEKPKMYIGLPKQYYWLIQNIVKDSKKVVKELDIIIALFKIKQNDSLVRMSEQFELSRPSTFKSFVLGIEVLANFFQNLVFMPTKDQVKSNLPLTFKIRFSNVYCILDAFEIEIQKPSGPLQQAQTWSQYKNCNTIKYLLGCTPNGFISYISKGFGGRISDKALVEKSDLLECLPSNSVVMADRGFKEVEALLMARGIRLLRPPSVYTSTKPTKDQVLQTKVIASLRVHVERVIRRVREFRLLKPHSVINYKHVSYLDQIVIIACGLVNLQDEIIKHN